MKTIIQYACAICLAFIIISCDTDVIPEGMSVLDKTSELELLLNSKSITGKPHQTLGVIVNEGYGQEFTILRTQIRNTNTLLSANLTYNEEVDRAALTASDLKYTMPYSTIESLNVLLKKIDDAQGEEARKPAIKAEARITRAYFHYLLANIYAKQYDAATAETERCIAYVDISDLSQKEQLTQAEVYQKMLDDCTDDLIALLPDESSVVRLNKAAGYAIRAKILFQMKNYGDALAYSQKALSLNSTIEDRTGILSSARWNLSAKAANNMLYVSPLSDYSAIPVGEMLSLETVALFEEGDLVKDHAMYSATVKYWDPTWGKSYSGFEGPVRARGYGAYVNAWGITVEKMMYLAAECNIRSNQIQAGLDLVNQIRQKRIDSEHYQPFAASTEEEAMALLQRAKFVECIGTYENFFDRKRWNSETKYRKDITRHLPDIGDYTITPESPFWVFPFPARVMQNNPGFRQNY